MNPEIKEKWLAALPEYSQTQEVLQLNGSFCCLGVLCDIARKEGIGHWDDDALEGRAVDFCVADDSMDTILPSAICNWANITETGSLPFRDRQDAVLTLAVANDEGCTFDQISDLIKHFF